MFCFLHRGNWSCNAVLFLCKGTSTQGDKKIQHLPALVVIMGGGITGKPSPGVPGRKGVNNDTAAPGIKGMPLDVIVTGIKVCGFEFAAAAAKGPVTAVTEAGKGWWGGVDKVGVTTAGPPSVGMARPGGAYKQKTGKSIL